VLRYRFIGDTILTIPFLRNLRRAEPEADIHLVLAPISGDVLKGIPYVDRILYWDPQTIHGDCLGTHRSLRAQWGFVRQLRSNRYDKVYVLKRSFSSALMGYLAGVPKRIGFDTEGRGMLLTTRVPYDHTLHEVRNFLNCLRHDGIEVTDDHLEAWVTEKEQVDAARFLTDLGWRPGVPVIAIHPFSAVRERSWPLDRFIELANWVWEERRWPVLWLGGKGDQGHAEAIRHGYKGGSLMAIGSTDIRQSMALLSLVRLFVGNDSGIMHLAAALHLPLVALFGPQSVEKFGPWGDPARCRVISKRFPCHPCRQRFFAECSPGPEGRPLCLESIRTEEVLGAIDRIMHPSEKPVESKG